MRNLLYLILGLLVVQLVLTIGLWIDRPKGGAGGGESAYLEPIQKSESSAPTTAMETTLPVTETAGEVASSPSGTAGGATIRVQILNGCGVPGIARKAQDWLVRNGYDVRDVGNADRQDYVQCKVIDRGGNLTAARDLADVLKIDQARVVKLSGSPSPKIDVTVVLGRDYKKLAFAR